jgi:hypothetical protein
LRYVTGPAAALAEAGTLSGTLDGYHLFHATRAELPRDLGRADDARTANERALALTANRPSSRCCDGGSAGLDGPTDHRSSSINFGPSGRLGDPVPLGDRVGAPLGVLSLEELRCPCAAPPAG